jgi:integrase/recombinase XerD
VIIVDPAEQVMQKSVISPLPTVLTPDEIDGVMAAADEHLHAPKPDTRYFALVELLLSTGIKKSECLALNLNHVDTEAPNGPILFVRYANPQYRYKERKIALSDSWVAFYPQYKSQYTLNDRLFPWSPRRLEYLLEDLSNEAGIAKHLSFEMCRWTCALTNWRAGMEHDKIRQKLGISKIQWREVSMKLRQLAGDQ